MAFSCLPICNYRITSKSRADPIFGYVLKFGPKFSADMRTTPARSALIWGG